MPDDDRPATADDERRVRPFADVLRSIDKGEPLDEAADLLVAVANAVKDTGKKGKVVVTLNVAPLTKENDTGQVVVTVAVTSTVPKRPPRPGVFYVDDDGNLTTRYPGQIAFDDTQLRVLPERKEAAK